MLTVAQSTFIKSAVRPEHYPDWSLHEVAFAGRSNVGKSSLINTLVTRRKLVKVSRTPGRTQHINFFQADFHDGRSLGLVDLPGYGFAKVPKRIQREWGVMLEAYLGGRVQLKALVIIMDIRRGMRAEDLQLYEALAHFGAQPILVFTKADKFSRNQRNAALAKIAREVGAPRKELLVFSSLSGLGRDALWERIEQTAMPTTPLAELPEILPTGEDSLG
jgi:GTP-binding protein